MTDDEIRAFVALDVTPMVDVLHRQAQRRVDMSGSGDAWVAARDALTAAPALAAEVLRLREENERLTRERDEAQAASARSEEARGRALRLARGALDQRDAAWRELGAGPVGREDCGLGMRGACVELRVVTGGVSAWCPVAWTAPALPSPPCPSAPPSRPSRGERQA